MDEPGWEPHLQDFIATIKCFVGERERLLDTQIILICRSGYRSSDAGRCLLEYGFTHVAHVRGGFEGDIDEKINTSTLMAGAMIIYLGSNADEFIKFTVTD